MVSVMYNDESPDVKCPYCGKGYDIEDMNDANPQTYMCDYCNEIMEIKEETVTTFEYYATKILRNKDEVSISRE